MSLLVRTAAALATFGVGFAVAHAAPAKPVTQEAVVACLADSKSLCKGVAPGGLRHLECLGNQPEKLQPACKEALQPITPTVNAWRQTCGKDIDKHCAGGIPGAGLGLCLQSKRKKLSKTCRSMLSVTEAATLLTCAADAQKLCATTEPGGGRVIECLANQRTKLSNLCRFGVDRVKWPVLNWRKDCGSEIDTHCGKTIPGWHALACLETHRAEVGAKCEKRMRNAEKVFTAVCKADIKTHCSSVAPGDGRVFNCLRDHHDQLKPGCRYLVPNKWAPAG